MAAVAGGGFHYPPEEEEYHDRPLERVSHYPSYSYGPTYTGNELCWLSCCKGSGSSSSSSDCGKECLAVLALAAICAVVVSSFIAIGFTIRDGMEARDKQKEINKATERGGTIAIPRLKHQRNALIVQTAIKAILSLGLLSLTASGVLYLLQLYRVAILPVASNLSAYHVFAIGGAGTVILSGILRLSTQSTRYRT